MPIGELALNAWILNVLPLRSERFETKVSRIENSCTQCRVSLADPNTRGHTMSVLQYSVSFMTKLLLQMTSVPDPCFSRA